MNSEENLRERVENILGPQRYSHTLGVAETARKLAEEYNLDTDSAYKAGLLHDICKGLSTAEMKEWLKDSTWSLDLWEEEIPQLQHAPASAARAEREFAVDDLKILEAIRYHSTGFAGMEKHISLLLVADKIEPGRSYSGIDELREMAFENIDEAVRMICENTIRYLLADNALIHPNTILVRNSILRGQALDDR